MKRKSFTRRRPFWLQAVVFQAVTFQAVILLTGLIAAGAEAQPAAPIVPVDPPIDVQSACPSWRWIGIRADTEPVCPRARGWRVSPLFTTPAAGTLPPALAPFCLYERLRRGDAAAIRALVGQGRLVRADRDCAAAAASADALGDLLRPTLQQQFLAQAGHVNLPAPFPLKKRVRLAFLDASPTKEDHPFNPDRSGHGYAMTQLARKLVCNGCNNGNCCAARLATRLALPVVKFDPEDPQKNELDLEHGGYLGTVAQLGVAIQDEVTAWQDSGEEHLVLNLSLAWNGELFGGFEADPDNMDGPIQSVYRALEVAVCRGALVVAAAGNFGGGPDNATGPLLPAGWQERAAPGVKACATALGIDESDVVAPTGSLVYAAGGVRHDGQSVANARPGAMPPLAAFADHATTAVAGNFPPTGVLTGTSVAAAVVSAASAAVWHYHPGLPRDAVMQILYDGGDELLLPSDFRGDDQPSEEVRRVSVCSALEEACNEEEECLKRLVCPPWDHKPPSLGPALEGFEQLGAQAHDVSKVKTPFDVPDFCTDSVDTILYDPELGDIGPPCPSEQFYDYDVEPWSGPQPGDPPCPSCSIDPGTSKLIEGCPIENPYALYIHIDSNWAGGDDTLTIAMFKIGGTLLYIENQVGELQPGDSATVECLDGSLLEGNSQVLLQFNSDSQGIVNNPVQVSGGP